MLKEKTFRTSARIAHKLGVAEAARRVLRNTPSPISKAIRKHEIVHRIKLVDDQAIDEAMRKVVGLVQEQSIDVENYFEFGVYNGSTLIAMTRALEAADLNHVRVFGFDTFAGLPEFASSDCHGHWKPGDFNSSIDFTRSVLEHERVDMSKVELVKGLFSDSCSPDFIQRRNIKKVSLVMIDCDLYQSTVDALAFCKDVFADTSIVMFDDWFPLADRNEGEKPAWNEFLAANSEWKADELFTYAPHGIVFKLTRVAP